MVGTKACLPEKREVEMIPDDRPGQIFLVIGAISAAVSVLAGAFGSHALKETESAEMLSVFDTASRYQMYHALGLLVLAVGNGLWGNDHRRGFLLAGILFINGTILFSGSLYVFVLADARWVTALTPLGGISFFAGWLVLAWSGRKQRSTT